MFVVLLRFAHNKDKAADFMDGHNLWLKRGFEDNVFLMAGSLQPGLGGSVIAHGVSKEALNNRINEDPFMIENIVTAEILEIEPRKTDDRLSFLLSGPGNSQ